MRGSTWGALLFLASAPLFSQSELGGIQLHESPSDIRRLLGEPLRVAEVNSEFISWQYRVGDFDHDEFSHALIFRKSTRTLVSISRTFDDSLDIDKLFPAKDSAFYPYPESGPVEMVVRVCRLPKDRLLLAFGSSKPGDPTNQLVLIDRSVVQAFYPWLASRLK